jgi:hypothetical protein
MILGSTHVRLRRRLGTWSGSVTLARENVTHPRRIVTFAALTHARSSGIVEIEGGGWYPTLDLGGGALWLGIAAPPARARGVR